MIGARETGAECRARLKVELARLGPLAPERVFSGWACTWALALDSVKFSADAFDEAGLRAFLADGGCICDSHGPAIGQVKSLELVTEHGVWIVGELAAGGVADDCWQRMCEGQRRGLSVKFTHAGGVDLGGLEIPAVAWILEVSVCDSPSDASSSWLFAEHREPIPPAHMPRLGEDLQTTCLRIRRGAELRRDLAGR